MRAAISAAVLVQCRGASLVWLATILCVLAALAERGRLRMLMRARIVQMWGILAAASSAFALWWLVTFDSLAIQRVGPRLHESFLLRLDAAAGETGSFIQQMVGTLGWLDVPPPLATVILWLGALTALVLLAVYSGPVRQTVVLGALALYVVVVPVVVDAYTAPRTGLIWEGRYTLPIASGIAVLAAGNSRLTAVSPRISGWLRVLIPAALCVAQIGLFLTALRRYAVGANGPFWPTGGPWSPPLGVLAALLTFVFAVGAYSAWVSYLARSQGGTGSPWGRARGLVQSGR